MAGAPSPWWEPTLSAMGACLDLARCRGIADKVGSHQDVAVKQGAVLCGVAVCGVRQPSLFPINPPRS